MKNLIKPGAEDFLWAGGIENTFVPQTRDGQRSLDEYELMGHYDNWRAEPYAGARSWLKGAAMGYSMVPDRTRTW